MSQPLGAIDLGARSPLERVRGWPDDVAARYRDLGLWTEETLREFWSRCTTSYADREAVVGRDAHGHEVRLTYADVAVRSRAAAQWLWTNGVRPGDRVVLTLPNRVEFVAALGGIVSLGAIPIFGLPAHRESELSAFCVIADVAAIVADSRSTGVDEWRRLVDAVAVKVAGSGVRVPVHLDVLSDELPSAVEDSASFDDLLAEVAQAQSADQIALLQLSGGTTGIPKLIPRTHADYLYSVRASDDICGVTAETRMLVVLPASHNFAMSSPGVLGVLHAGGCLVLAPDASPGTAFRMIAAERVTMASLVPPLVQAWLASAARRTPDLSSLAVVQVGGAKLAPSVAEQIRPVLGAQLQQVFGMAEGLVNYTRFDDPDDIVVNSQGRPISAADEIRIVSPDDPEGPEVPAGAEGTLLTRGPYTIRSYYRAGPVGEDSFTSDGFYRTGDLVRQLPSGHLIVTGRDKDQINRAGEKIAVDEIEEAALRHPDVHDVVAVGEPDDYLGERICLVVVPSGEFPAADTAAWIERLRTHLRAQGLADHKLPDRVQLIAAFPSTAVGKNSRRDLRRLIAHDLTDSQPVGGEAR